ncbi:MAG: methylamine dehydrogenase accessory protein MauD [Steroidobacteraceae bacterium]
MADALLISNILLWVLVVVLALVVLALTRQIGVLHERVAPAGALMLAGGPKVGEQAPVLEATDLDGGSVAIGGANDAGLSSLLFFLSPTCPVCKSLLPVLQSSRKAEQSWLRVILASDGEISAQRAFVADSGLGEFRYVVSTALGLAYQVSKLPYAVLIDDQGILRAKGLVNSREHLESLFAAKETGFASVQEYLSRS